MASRTGTRSQQRAPLSRERVLRAAIALADEGGIESLSMRRLGQALGVEAMSLYNHVANKGDLLDGMVDLVWSEMEVPVAEGGWRAAVRSTALSANDVLARHPWACDLAMSPERSNPARLRYMEALLRTFRDGGFSPDLTFHAYHAVDAHVIGFTLWQHGHSIPSGDVAGLIEGFLAQIEQTHPYLAEHARQHLDGVGREGEGEFAFVLDLILDGLERAHEAV